MHSFSFPSVAHRLSLAVSQACAGTSEMVIYNYVELSPTRLERFTEVTAEPTLDIIKLNASPRPGKKKSKSYTD